MFLAIAIKDVVDQRFQPEVVEDLTAKPPIKGRAEVPLKTHEEFDVAYVEQEAETVARNMVAGRRIKYYHIGVNVKTFDAMLLPVKIKGGSRVSAPDREVVEIEAGGQDVGSVVAEV